MKELKNNWKQLNKIILNILSVDFLFSNNINKTLVNCNFDNIAKGRCLINIELKKVGKKKMKFLFFQIKPLLM